MEALHRLSWMRRRISLIKISGAHQWQSGLSQCRLRLLRRPYPRFRFLVDAAGFVEYISAMVAHDHDHNEGSNLSEVELRVRALETILVDKRQSSNRIKLRCPRGARAGRGGVSSLSSRLRLVSYHITFDENSQCMKSERAASACVLNRTTVV